MTTHKIILPETGYVRLPIILGLIPVSKATWWRGVKSGRFPAALKMGERITVWRVEDIRHLIATISADCNALSC